MQNKAKQSQNKPKQSQFVEREKLMQSVYIQRIMNKIVDMGQTKQKHSAIYLSGQTQEHVFCLTLALSVKIRRYL